MKVDLEETEARLLRRLFLNHKQVRALVVGDFMLDEYIRGTVNRISPEAPVQVIDIKSKDKYLGGAGNVVNNLVSMGAELFACGVVGEDSDGKWLVDVMESKGVKVDGLFFAPERKTTTKQRVIAGYQQMLRLDSEEKTLIDSAWEDKIINYLTRTIEQYDVVILSDYKKGVLTPRVLKFAISISRENKKPVIIDPKGDDYTNYRGATLITPNKKEASLAANIDICDMDSLFHAGEFFLEELDIEAVLITRSEEGMSLFRYDDRDKKSVVRAFHASTKAREVFDITGAGDTVLSALGICLASEIPLKEAVEIANIAAGISVGKIGTAAVTVEEIFSEIESYEMTGLRKIKDYDDFLDISNQLKKIGKRIVLTFGCFDLLELKHIRFFEQSKRMGDYFMVGVYSDAVVNDHFGNDRPYIQESERTQIVAAMGSIDYVTIIDKSCDPAFLVEKMLPDILTESSDSLKIDKNSVVNSEVKIIRL